MRPETPRPRNDLKDEPMYETSFRLQRRPFAATPDARCFFESESRSTVIRDLVAVVEGERGTGILYGATGLGKTATLIHLGELFREKWTTLRISAHGIASPRALLQALLYELGERYTGLDEQECRLELRSALKRLARSQKPAVLLVDEGEQLTWPLLAELRGLVEEVESGRSLLRLVIAGQPALEDHLLAPEASAFNQRVASQQYLSPLTQSESAAYVAYRLAWAGGGQEELFTPEAEQLVIQTSDGVPRCLNQLCDHALLLAFVVESPQVTRKQVEEALSDLKQLPLHWNMQSVSTVDAAATTEESAAEHVTAPEPLTNAAAFEVGAEPPTVTTPAASISATVHSATPQPVVTVTTNVTPADLLPACEVDASTAARLDAYASERTLGEMRISGGGAFPVGEEWSLPASGSSSFEEQLDAGDTAMEDSDSGSTVPAVDLSVRAPWTPPAERPQPDFDNEVVRDRWSPSHASSSDETAFDTIEPLDRVETAPAYAEPISEESWSQTMEQDTPPILALGTSTTRFDAPAAAFEPRNLQRSFEAEAVFDRYAALDAGRTDLPPAAAPATRRDRAATTSTGRPRLFAERPDLTAGAILNLVTSLDGDEQPSAAPTGPDESRENSANAIAPGAPNAASELDSAAPEPAAEWDDDLEASILNSTREMLAEVRSQLPQANSELATVEASPTDAVGDDDYDVIEPVAGGPIPAVTTVAAPSGSFAEPDDFDAPCPTRTSAAQRSSSERLLLLDVEPSGERKSVEASTVHERSVAETVHEEPEATIFSPYKRLFSMLRRKQKRSA